MTSDKMQLEADMLREIAEQILDDVALIESIIIQRATRRKRGKRHENHNISNDIYQSTSSDQRRIQGTVQPQRQHDIQ